MIVAKKQFFSIKILYIISGKGYNLLMKKDNIKTLRETELEKHAKENFDNLSKYQTNPIKAKFEAFKKTKKEIELKD